MFKYLPIIIPTALLLIVGYLTGRLTTNLEAVYHAPGFTMVQDRNNKVPVVDIKKITDEVLEGTIEHHNVRIIVNGKLAEVDEFNHFRINVQDIMHIVEIPIPEEVNFVASERGKKFYPVGSKAGERIKPENRVYFETREEAERAGYSF